MKDEKVHGACETRKLKKINRVLKTLISIAIGFFAILLLLGVGVNIAFYLLSFFCITGLFILPLLEWIDMELKKYSIGNLFSIIISSLLSVMLCILLYFIFNVDSLGEKPYYSLLNNLIIQQHFLHS